jgi:hypothetical protein
MRVRFAPILTYDKAKRWTALQECEGVDWNHYRSIGFARQCDCTILWLFQQLHMKKVLRLFCLPFKEFYGTWYSSGLPFLNFMWGGVVFTACVVVSFLEKGPTCWHATGCTIQWLLVNPLLTAMDGHISYIVSYIVYRLSCIVYRVIYRVIVSYIV